MMHRAYGDLDAHRRVLNLARSDGSGPLIQAAISACSGQKTEDRQDGRSSKVGLSTDAPRLGKRMDGTCSSTESAKATRVLLQAIELTSLVFSGKLRSFADALPAARASLLETAVLSSTEETVNMYLHYLEGWTCLWCEVVGPRRDGKRGTDIYSCPWKDILSDVRKEWLMELHTSAQNLLLRLDAGTHPPVLYVVCVMMHYLTLMAHWLEGSAELCVWSSQRFDIQYCGIRINVTARALRHSEHIQLLWRQSGYLLNLCTGSCSFDAHLHCSFSEQRPRDACGDTIEMIAGGLCSSPTPSPQVNPGESSFTSLGSVSLLFWMRFLFRCWCCRCFLLFQAVLPVDIPLRSSRLGESSETQRTPSQVLPLVTSQENLVEVSEVDFAQSTTTLRRSVSFQPNSFLPPGSLAVDAGLSRLSAPLGSVSHLGDSASSRALRRRADTAGAPHRDLELLDLELWESRDGFQSNNTETERRILRLDPLLWRVLEGVTHYKPFPATCFLISDNTTRRGPVCWENGRVAFPESLWGPPDPGVESRARQGIAAWVLHFVYPLSRLSSDPDRRKQQEAYLRRTVVFQVAGGDPADNRFSFVLPCGAGFVRRSGRSLDRGRLYFALLLHTGQLSREGESTVLQQEGPKAFEVLDNLYAQWGMEKVLTAAQMMLESRCERTH